MLVFINVGQKKKSLMDEAAFKEVITCTNTLKKNQFLKEFGHMEAGGQVKNKTPTYNPLI